MNDNRFCVYVHKDSNGVVKYVGSGTLKRAYENYPNSFRGKCYSEFVLTNGKLDVEVFVEGLSKTDAEHLERELYDKYSETILNARRPVSAVILTKEIFEEYLYYGESSKSCLYWKVDVGLTIKAGSEAGSLHKPTGYYAIQIKGRSYYAHRIVSVLHGLEVNGFVVDHIDRNRSNNKIENLRVVSQKENMQNRSCQKLSSNNTSGVQGVYYAKSDNAWIASWYEYGEQKCKSFAIKSYPSSEQALNAASEYRNQMLNAKQTTSPVIEHFVKIDNAEDKL